MKYRRLLLSTLLVWCFSLPIAAKEDPVLPFQLSGWKEVLVSVSDLSASVAFFQEVGGWEVRYRGQMKSSQLARWALPEHVTAEEVVMGNIGSETGFVRLVQFSGVPQRQIRSNSQTWEPGGILDINLRVADMQKKYAEMQALGWQGANDPVRFTFGPFEVSEWITRGPDGLSFALIERHKPQLSGWPNLREFSRAFNSTQVVGDMEASRHFYMDLLGFEKYLYHKGASSGNGNNVLGLPFNLAREVDREIWILHPQGINEGSVELLSFEGLEGRDFAEHVRPPNLGMLALQFPVNGIEALEARLRAADVSFAVDLHTGLLPPYGKVQQMTAIAPNGTWLQFYEMQTADR